MKCEMYKKFQLGRIGDREYDLHEKACPACREMHFQDKQLLSAARKLRVPVNTVTLWDKLESRLKAELKTNRSNEKSRTKLKIPIQLGFFLKAAAFLIGIGLLALFFWNLSGKQSSGLLSQQALNKVEETERSYIAAIDELEKQSGTRLDIMDIELSFLYRDRLDTIDEQIQRCQNALKKNPANHQVRRYLLAALQDKNDTLREIVAFEPEST